MRRPDDTNRSFFDGVMKGAGEFRSIPADTRRFLAAATEFEDGPEMIYRLTSPEEHGSKLLRLAVCAETSASFLTEHVQPLLQRLGYEQFHIGTCEASMDGVLDVIFKRTGFIKNLGDVLQSADPDIFDPTPIGCFLLNVASRLKVAREDAAVRVITEVLAARGLPIAQKLQTVLDGGPGVAAAAQSSLETRRTWR